MNCEWFSRWKWSVQLYMIAVYYNSSLEDWRAWLADISIFVQECFYKHINYRLITIHMIIPNIVWFSKMKSILICCTVNKVYNKIDPKEIFHLKKISCLGSLMLEDILQIPWNDVFWSMLHDYVTEYKKIRSGLFQCFVLWINWSISVHKLLKHFLRYLCENCYLVYNLEVLPL